MDELERFAKSLCKHGSAKWEISPYDGDVWCFACNPPRNLSEDYRRMQEQLETAAPPEPQSPARPGKE